MHIVPVWIAASPNAPAVHYILVREDLPDGMAIVAAVHAAGESSPGFLPLDTFAVVLSVPDEAALMRWHERPEPHVLIREPDAPWDNQAMAIGFVPGPRARFRFLSQLPLYARVVQSIGQRRVVGDEDAGSNPALGSTCAASSKAERPP